MRRGGRLASLRLRDRRDFEVTLETTGEKPLLLNFWASTCTTCIKELPLLEARRAAGDFRVVTVSLDPPGSRDRAAGLWSQLSLSLDAYWMDNSVANELFDLARLAIPVTFVLSSEGVIERIIQGSLKESDL